jgi:hypothetical protein
MNLDFMVGLRLGLVFGFLIGLAVAIIAVLFVLRRQPVKPLEKKELQRTILDPIQYTHERPLPKSSPPAPRSIQAMLLRRAGKK